MITLFKKVFEKLRSYAGRWWYDPLVATCAAADAFLVFISIEALIIAKIIVQPSRWIITSLWASVGSAVGATALGVLVSFYGDTIVNRFFPGALQSHAWIKTTAFLDAHGLLGLGLIAFGPFPQHIGVAISGLAHMSATKIFWAIFLGRAAKYLMIAFMVKHSPQLLKKLGIIPRLPNESASPL